MSDIVNKIQEHNASIKLNILKSFISNGNDRPDSGEHESISDGEKLLDNDVTNDNVETGEIGDWKKNKIK